MNIPIKPAQDTGDISRMLRQAGARDEADMIDIFDRTGESVIALTQGVLDMQKHSLPVSADLARAALIAAKNDGGDDEVAGARKALAAALVRKDRMIYTMVGVTRLHNANVLYDMDWWEASQKLRYIKDSTGAYINLNDRLKTGSDAPRYWTEKDATGYSIYYDMRTRKPVMSDCGTLLLDGGNFAYA